MRRQLSGVRVIHKVLDHILSNNAERRFSRPDLKAKARRTSDKGIELHETPTNPTIRSTR